jgi:hypothetical protein
MARVWGLLCFAATGFAAQPPLPPAGASAWVYDDKNGPIAMWADEIGMFNDGAKTPINTIWSYGGDMEYYPREHPPYQTYFDAHAQAAALKYGSTKGVDYVVTVIDGVMNGGESWSPDLSKFNEAQLKEWADVTTTTYCKYDQVDGIQMDLEPFAGKYKAPFLIFLKELASNLRNCTSARHPMGRSVTTFMFADDVTPEVWSALGPNGYMVVSGYDLASTPAGTPSTVEYFSTRFSQAVDTIVASATANKGSYFIGIPAAASTHEFANLTYANGTIVQGSPQIRYVTAALDILAAKAKGKPGYLGPSLWGFSSVMAYPPHSQNLYRPETPFVLAEEAAYLKRNL